MNAPDQFIAESATVDQAAIAPLPGSRKIGSPPESQAWDFIAQPDSSYAIRLAGSNLFITAASSETNAPVTIEPFSGADSQKWRLIPQKPWF